jgi:hypothetical protein
LPALPLLLGIWILIAARPRPGDGAAADGRACGTLPASGDAVTSGTIPTSGEAMTSGTLPAAVFAAGSLWWFGLALFGALASGRSYLHYYLQAVPPAAICLALLAGGLRESRQRLARYLTVGLIAVWTVAIPVVSWQAVIASHGADRPATHIYGYYGYAWQHLTGALSYQALGDRMDARVERNVAVADYLRSHAVKPERLYVWGNTPWIYYLSGYEHATRFFSAYYHPAIPNGMTQVLATLRADLPPYVVVIEPASPATPALNALLNARYQPVWHYREAVIFRLRTPARSP